MLPGMGTVVAARPAACIGDRQRLLQREVEQLVVDARHAWEPRAIAELFADAPNR